MDGLYSNLEELQGLRSVFTHEFLEEAEQIWTDDELAEFTDYIARNPEAGALIPGLGGTRKIRWSRAGMGKRGGVRVIYYYYDERLPIVLFDVYTKSAKDDIDPKGKKAILKAVATIKAGLKERDK